MTDDRKIRDLIRRMVSMSPEPPPYPEEITMAHPSTTRRRSPALIFAAAAVAVVVLAVPLLLWDGGDGAPVGGGTSVPGTTVPPVTTTEPGATTTTEPDIVQAITQPVFLAQMPVNSPSNNPAIIPILLTVEEPDGLPADVQQAAGSPVGMLLNHDALGVVLPAGVETYVPAGVQVLDSTVTGSLITLDMNEAFLDGAGGLLADFTMLNQLVYTATITDLSARVLFTVNGAPVEAFGTEGISLLDPVGRDDYLDHLNPIVVTRTLEVTDNEIRVVGKANVYEATLSYRVSGTDIEGFVNATCGTGCWGDFEISLSTGGLATGSVLEIFSASAEDGSPMFLIRIPLG